MAAISLFYLCLLFLRFFFVSYAINVVANAAMIPNPRNPYFHTLLLLSLSLLMAMSQLLVLSIQDGFCQSKEPIMTIQQYADEHCISYETVRRQVAKNKRMLGAHITIWNKTQYLDEYAIDFLDQLRSLESQNQELEGRIKEERELRYKAEQECRDMYLELSRNDSLSKQKKKNKELEVQVSKEQELRLKAEQEYEELLKKYIITENELSARADAAEKYAVKIESILREFSKALKKPDTRDSDSEE